MSSKLPIILGSSSKWRADIVRSHGVPIHDIVSPDIDEKAIRTDDPCELTMRIAQAKMEAVKAQVNYPAILITCDQVIVWKDQVREKPVSHEECRQFLRSYAEAPAKAVSSLVVLNTQTQQQLEAISVSIQYFKPLDEDKIDQLILQGDVLTCAGGFTIEHMQDYLGLLVGERETIEGMSIASLKGLLDQL